MIPQVEIGDSYLGLFDGRINDQFVLIEGKRGTAKTRAILTLLVCRALAHPGSRWLIVRSTRTRLSESAMATLYDQVLPLFGLRVPGGQRSQATSYRFPNGSEFIFQGLDDAGRQQSVECCGIYVVEGVEIPVLETITALAGAMRQACAVPVPVHQCLVDCNPGSPAHPLNKIAEDVPDSMRRIDDRAGYEALVQHNQRPSSQPGRWKRIVTQHFDNPGYFDAAKWVWRAAGLAYLKTLSWLTGHFLSRWLYGLWCAAEGSVFPEFSDTNQIEPFAIPSTWPLWAKIDPGYDHPCAVTWGTVAPNGKRYTVAQLYERQNSIPQIAAKIHAKNQEMEWTLTAVYLDPRHGFAKTQQSPITIAEQFAKEGIKCQPWPAAKGAEIEASVAAHRKAVMQLQYMVFKDCVDVIGEHQSWSYKRNAAGEQLAGDDAYEDKNNHCIDTILGWERTNPQHKPHGITVSEPPATGSIRVQEWRT